MDFMAENWVDVVDDDEEEDGEVMPPAPDLVSVARAHKAAVAKAAAHAAHVEPEPEPEPVVPPADRVRGKSALGVARSAVRSSSLRKKLTREEQQRFEVVVQASAESAAGSGGGAAQQAGGARSAGDEQLRTQLAAAQAELARCKQALAARTDLLNRIARVAFA